MSIRITREQLAEALKIWDEESQANNWPARTDEQRHLDNADYLLEKMGFGPVPIPGKQIGTIS